MTQNGTLPHQLAWTGLPPPERRCTYVYRHSERCKKWSMKGKDRCRRHGGRTHSAAHAAPRLRGVPVFYSKILGKTLTDKLQELTESPSHEQLQVREELALTRITALDVVQLYDAVSQKAEADPANAKLHEAKISCGMTMREVLSSVADMCDRAVRIEAAIKDKISVHHIVVIVNQIVRIAHETFGEDHPALATRFEELVRTQVRLPKEGSDGTDITPDQDVMEMDATVPAGPTSELEDEAIEEVEET